MQLWTNIAIEGFEKQIEIRLIGEILNETWKLKRRLAEGVSTDDIDSIYDTAIKAGAYGGKLMGAGGGGFFMFIAPPDKHEEIKNKVKQINVWVPFKFDHDGSQIIMG
jgi:D-glycero-alpha-D-manno-heptose-7-phosphate kinase